MMAGSRRACWVSWNDAGRRRGRASGWTRARDRLENGRITESSRGISNQEAPKWAWRACPFSRPAVSSSVLLAAAWSFRTERAWLVEGRLTDNVFKRRATPIMDDILETMKRSDRYQRSGISVRRMSARTSNRLRSPSLGMNLALISIGTGIKTRSLRTIVAVSYEPPPA